ncbi:MAG: glycine betaine ABC transporter substrate-binding protein [Peptoniphilus sp.]|nr:glycine betaine ABC transporter substrate-binding protein [Peptoniphilus sp.]
MNKIKKFLLLLILLCFLLAGCSSQSSSGVNKEIKFADAGWDSVKFHSAVAGTILQELYGYTWSEVTASTPVAHQGLISGEIDIMMEAWTQNIPSYDEDVAAGKLEEVGVNFDDNYQGIYVPRYVVEGDEERGIEPSAPDLINVWDLKNYPDVFKDDEDSSKGRVYGAIPGWEIDNIMHKKYLHYGLDENFVYFRPGSEAALATAITSAYEKGVPVAAYYWEPTWLLGKYDMVLLQDKPYDPELFPEGQTECPSVVVTICSSNDFSQDNPQVIDFLSKYKTSSALTSEALAYMQDNKADYITTAKWFIQEHPELLKEWLSPEDAQKVLNSISGKEASKLSSLYKFPVNFNLNLEKIDAAFNSLSVQLDWFFGAIKGFLNTFVGAINTLLSFIPWFAFIALVFVLTYYANRSFKNSILYSALLFIIGGLGLWNLMLETLSIVIASVIISLLLGFPIGVLVSTSDKADRIIRPILDTMQTMPVFVYLIPAMIFFGLGKPPAVIATTIYSIVPMIRLTNHGIRQIDKEVIEASIAFGSTRFQSLVKVQIPQALPTIMTGVNQTLMMAMSMVVTTSMIGASGLGMEVLLSVNRVEIGRGLISGSAVVIIAIILDRITQGFVKKSEVKTNE